MARSLKRLIGLGQDLNPGPSGSKGCPDNFETQLPLGTRSTDTLLRGAQLAAVIRGSRASAGTCFQNYLADRTTERFGHFRAMPESHHEIGTAVADAEKGGELATYGSDLEGLIDECAF
jgi:hypothetical protein